MSCRRSLRTPATLALAVSALLIPACVPAPGPGLPAAPEVEMRIDSAERHAKEITVRVRNRGCDHHAVGSGFAIGPSMLVSNRHVLDGGEVLQVNSWDGRSYDVDAARVALGSDLGIVNVRGQLPGQAVLASEDLEPGDEVMVAGYPDGGVLALTRGYVVDSVEGEPFGETQRVVRLSAEVRQGSSGGPVLDRHGRVAAVVFGIESVTGYSLAVPVDTLVTAMETASFVATPPCGRPGR